MMSERAFVTLAAAALQIVLAIYSCPGINALSGVPSMHHLHEQLDFSTRSS